MYVPPYSVMRDARCEMRDVRCECNIVPDNDGGVQGSSKVLLDLESVNARIDREARTTRREIREGGTMR
jgi:hypothetical protein